MLFHSKLLRQSFTSFAAALKHVCIRYVDAVLTIPKGTLFPMCGMNLGFDRDLIGPAMYFGLMGDGQPIGRYDDMWAGWCVKVKCVSFALQFSYHNSSCSVDLINETNQTNCLS